MKAHAPARVRSRRVQTSFDVLPRSVRPKGPVATVAVVTMPAAGVTAIPSNPASAAASRTRLGGCHTHHHRAAKRETEPGA